MFSNEDTCSKAHKKNKYPPQIKCGRLGQHGIEMEGLGI
jgi:hypothetical protein